MHICGDIDNIIGKGEEMRLRKRVHSAFIATVLTCSLAVTPVFAAPDTLESLQQEQENLQNQKEAAQSELNSLQSDLDTIVTKLADLEDQLIAKGEEIIKIKADLEAAEEKRQEQYDAMKLRIKYMYEAGSGTATMEKVMADLNTNDTATIDFTNKIKVMKIRRDDQIQAFKPYQAYIYDGSYPLYRSVYVTTTEPNGSLSHGFYSFITGFIGQKIILNTGVMPAIVQPRLVSLN